MSHPDYLSSNQRVTSVKTLTNPIFSSNLLAEIREQEVLARFVRTQADTEYFSRKFIDKLLYISNVFEARISCSLTKQ